MKVVNESNFVGLQVTPVLDLDVIFVTRLNKNGNKMSVTTCLCSEKMLICEYRSIIK